MSAPQAPASLLHRPEARSFSVEDLVRRVLDGQIRVPDFQRELKWEVEDVLALLDSVYRGYPVGTLLLWQRSAEAQHLRYGSVAVDAAQRSDALWLVDGQQRVRALTQALAGAGHPTESFACFFDLRAARFVHVPRREEPQPDHVPMTVVLDPEKTLAWLVDRRISEATRREVIQLGKRIREHQIPAVLVTTEDEAVVREIFRRANDTGRRMEEHEVFDAIHHRSGSLSMSLRDVAAALLKLQFGGPDEATLLRSMLPAIHGEDATSGRAQQSGPHEESSALQRSIESTITFLRRDAYIPHLSLLPYQGPLFALALLFLRFPEPQPRSRELMARWLWRGALTGAHADDRLRTGEMLAALERDEAAAVAALLERSPPHPSQSLRLDGTLDRHAASAKIQVLALLSLAPRDLATGDLVVLHDSPWEGSLHKIVDREQGGLANHLLHPPVHHGIVQAIVDCEDSRLLASHGISDAARRALASGHEDEFLALRSETLRAVVDDFTERRAEWDEIDAPAVDSLVEEP